MFTRHCITEDWYWHYNVRGEEHNKNVMLGAKVRRKVKLVQCWNADSNSRQQVEEVIKKIPFGVTKTVSWTQSVQSGCWHVAGGNVCWLTGCDTWYAADSLDCMLNGIFLLIHTKMWSSLRCSRVPWKVSESYEKNIQNIFGSWNLKLRKENTARWVFSLL